MLIRDALVVEQVRLSRVLGFRDLIVNLPSLNVLELGFKNSEWDLHPTAFEVIVFPSVACLTLRDWPFHLSGPTRFHHRLDHARLKHLRLDGGYVNDCNCLILCDDIDISILMGFTHLNVMASIVIAELTSTSSAGRVLRICSLL